MKSILVIGMGRFGRHLSRKLAELDNQVMVVDQNEEKVRDLLPIVTTAQIGDCTDEEVLHSLGVANFDICFVCTGSSLQSSLEVTALLKDLGARYIISKISRDIHAKFLLRMGADEVIYPEREIAEKVAVRCSAHNLFDYIELTKEVGIYEISPLDGWIGKSIRVLNFRVNYNLSILATKEDGQLIPMPPPEHVFKVQEHLMVMGRHHDVEKILKELWRKERNKIL